MIPEIIKRESSQFKVVKPYYLIPNLFNTEDVDSLVREVLKNNNTQDRFLKGEKSVGEGQEFTCHTIPVKGFEKEYELVYSAIIEANRKNFHFDEDLVLGHEMLMNEYRGEEYTGWHVDGYAGDNPDYYFRKLSCVVQLSDPEEYIGGSLDLYKYHSIKSKETSSLYRKGSAIVFPSFEWHQVSPIISGVRKSLIMFAEGRNAFL